MRVVWRLAALLVAVGGGVVGYVYSGLYDAAAATPHSPPVRWLLSAAMRSSVERRAAGIVPPFSLENPERTRSGFAAYDDMCAVCHGTPGSEPSVIAQGLNPEAPDLADEADEWSDGELFWIIKQGIRMTGMPAFGPTHDEGELWDVVAFVRQLPELDAQEYQRLRDERARPPAGPGSQAPEHSHSHSDSHTDSHSHSH
jgi:mono/diheme cytochrome c family protein